MPPTRRPPLLPGTGTLRRLNRVLEACARLGSFARAAEEFHLSQPAAPLQIKKLGETLGVTLYEQIGKRIHLTEAGERVVQTCRELFDVFGALDGSTRPAACTLQAGRLRLAVSTTGMCFAPRLVGSLSTSTRTEASVQGFNRQSLVERMAGNEDDLYLFADAPDMGDVVAQMLLPNRMVVLAQTTTRWPRHAGSPSSGWPRSRSCCARKARARGAS